MLDRLGVGCAIGDVVEVGCGYGTFSLPIARRITGTVCALDVDPDMVDRTRRRAAASALHNVVCTVADVHSEDIPLASASADACLLFNILHGEDPVRLLTEATRVLRPGGEALVTHWRCDVATPRGPSMDIRPRPEQILAWAAQTGCLAPTGPVLDLPPWHYGLRLARVHGPDSGRVVAVRAGTRLRSSQQINRGR